MNKAVSLKVLIPGSAATASSETLMLADSFGVHCWVTAMRRERQGEAPAVL